MFSYELPEERIAQRPKGYASARSDSRLLHATVSPQSSDLRVNDCTFVDLPQLLRADDVLVLNDTKVVPARVFAQLERTKREVELLFIESPSPALWEAIARPMKKLRVGDTLLLDEALRARVLGRTMDERRIRLEFEQTEALEERIHAAGIMPIPPYIRKGRADDSDQDLYQTVFAQQQGSLAAPTASLHFTEEVLAEISARGVEIVYLTHHVGTGSVRPVTACELEEHTMESESYCISQSARETLIAAKAKGRRLVAVGTTVVRALESEFMRGAGVCPEQDPGLIETSLFIYPGHSFAAVDALITNFHQPSSTHLQLVAAFFGAGPLESVYQHALADAEYRFLTYGDSSFLEFA